MTECLLTFNHDLVWHCNCNPCSFHTHICHPRHCCGDPTTRHPRDRYGLACSGGRDRQPGDLADNVTFQFQIIDGFLQFIKILLLLLLLLLRPVGVRSIVINPSVCASVCLSICDHISGTAGPIFTKFCVHIPCGRGSVLLRRRCATLCTSGLWMTSLLAAVGRRPARVGSSQRW